MLRIVALTDERAAYDIDRAAAEADAPDIPFSSFETYCTRLRHPWPGNEAEQYLAVHDGTPAGHLELYLPQLDNLANVIVELFVHPDHRRRGTGRALLAHAVRRATELGRRHLISEAVAADAFARAAGAIPALLEIRSRLDITGPLPDDSPAAAGYRLVRWTDEAPEELLDDIGYLDSRLNEDAPTGELAVESEKIDADRVRAAEETLRLRRRTTFHTGAVHEQSGRLVAWTMIASENDTGWHAWQNITIVDPDHRGHGLGLTIKNHNLRYARTARPGLRAIDTSNAVENEHMLRINQAMGFRPVDRWTQWQLTV
ncbi:GNAT family N-acetyltransferase [Actinoplanes sp. NPDC048791]|uniref:GNAT family N-acetyltransferase n=1 Tax=Actinoplanes sp. NPDC048791 TaxID=3154623 RepID=UPI0033CA5529